MEYARTAPVDVGSMENVGFVGVLDGLPSHRLRWVKVESWSIIAILELPEPGFGLVEAFRAECFLDPVPC